MTIEDVETVKELGFYETKLDQGQYLEVMKKLQAHYGHYKTWLLPELSIISSRCCTHLGMERTADAIILNAWRRNRNSPLLVVNYLSVIHRRKGAVLAWDASHKLQSIELPEKQKSQFFCELANIACIFRDFSQAESIIRQAKECDVNAWVLQNEAYVLFLQDEYDRTLQALEALLKKNKNYRPAHQLIAHVLVLQGKSSDAVSMLESIEPMVDSVSLVEQLIYLYIDLKDYSKAESLITRLDSLYFEKTKQSISNLNSVKADILCAQQRYQEALPLLEEKNFYHRKISASIKKNSDQSERCVLDVPFVRQHHMTCTPASITAVAAYWGVQLEQEDIISQICYDGTPDVDERRWIIDQGWTVIEFVLNDKTIRQLIDKNIPVFLSTVEPGSAHMQVIVGYDHALGIYLLRDPYYPRLQEFLIKETQEYYRSSGPRCMIMLPKEKLETINDIELIDSVLYDHYYQLNKAMDENNRELAVEAYDVMVKEYELNILTTKAQRAIAIYDRDESSILKQTEIILEKFPDDVNFQLSKISSLSFMGSYETLVEYLSDLCSKVSVNDLIKSRYAMELVKDQRQQSKTEKLLKSLIKNRYNDASVLKIYADNLWANGHYKLSYEMYRFITCLEDKNEHYASSYFKAARYFKETDIALEFLIDRYRRFTSHSSGPVISLFKALDLLERSEEGLDFLEKAIRQRPDDGDLMLFTAEQYFIIQNIEQAEVLFNRAKPLVHDMRYAEMAAKMYEHQQNYDAAIEAWQSILVHEPLNYSANKAIVRLMYEVGNETKADDFINQQLERFPNNYSLLRIKVEWSARNDIKLEESVLRCMIEHHGDDNWAHKQLSEAMRQQFRFDEAEQLAKEGISIRNDDAYAYSALAQAYEGMSEYEQAVKWYRQAIYYSCDCTEVYELLLNCVVSREGKKKELQYIYDELMRQVTFGDGLLEFQRIARNWYTRDELLAFLSLAASERPDLWQSWLALSLEYGELGEYQQSLKVIDQVIDRFPLLPRLLLEKAEIFFLMNDLAAAEKFLKKTIELSPEWNKALNRLSEILEYQNKIKEAIELLQYLIKRSPMSFSSYAYLADLLWKGGEKQTAIETLIHVLKLFPLYHWAWDRLGYMCKEDNQYSIVIEKILTQRKIMPENEELACIHADLVIDVHDKEDIYRSFLSLHPRAIDLSINFIHYLVDNGQYGEALDLCRHERWGEIIPVSIQANNAWVTHAKGSVNKAIQLMKDVLVQDPNYYDGWRFLVHWYNSIGESEQVLDCINHCERLYPNNANVLCFVAEFLQKQTDKENFRVSDLLKRAYFLDPTNSYNGLTYIDFLIEEKDFDAVQEVLLSLRVHNDNVYTTGRELAFYLKQGKMQEALLSWKALISNYEADEDLISYAWNLIADADWENQACEVINQQRSRSLDSTDELINEYAGIYWTYTQIDKIGIKKFEKNMEAYQVKDRFDDRVLTGYMECLLEQEREISDQIISQNYQRLQDDIKNWDLVIYTLGMQDQWRDVRRWAENRYQREDAQSRALYFYMLSLRQLGEWDKALYVNCYALNRPRDDYYDELLVWDTFDALINKKTVLSSEELFDYVDTDNLSSLSNYVLTLIDVLITAQQGSFIELYIELSPKLRTCQLSFSKNYGHKALEEARKQTRLLLKQSINTSFFNNLFWQWRLANHF